MGFQYAVKARHSLACKGGMLGPGEVVTASQVGSEARLEEMCAIGVLEKIDTSEAEARAAAKLAQAAAERKAAAKAEEDALAVRNMQGPPVVTMTVAEIPKDLPAGLAKEMGIEIAPEPEPVKEQAPEPMTALETEESDRPRVGRPRRKDR